MLGRTVGVARLVVLLVAEALGATVVSAATGVLVVVAAMVVVVAAMVVVVEVAVLGRGNHEAGLARVAADSVGLTVLPVALPRLSLLSVMIAHQYVPMPFGLVEVSAAEM